jgi:hypothetical protein
MTEKWHAVCRDCDEFEKMSPGFGDVLEAAMDHEDATGHNVEGERIDTDDVDDDAGRAEA